MKILLVHGVGRSDNDPNYYEPWKTAITAGFTEGGALTLPTFDVVHYDDVFQKYDRHPGIYAAAAVELIGSAAVHAVTDPISAAWHGLFHPGTRDLSEIGDKLRWTAGMVAQFVVETDLRRELRDLIFGKLNEDPQHPFDLVAAHSLGSLLTFDFLRNDKRAPQFRSLTYLTFGSQINNPFVRSKLWPGRLVMPELKFWYHLFNPQDPVLTADIPQTVGTNFRSVIASSPAGHAPTSIAGNFGYLDNPETQKQVWDLLASPSVISRDFERKVNVAGGDKTKPRQRALLIGINNYPDPANRLEGCINDVFHFSAMLQERGFPAEDIRVVLDERATADGIRERLGWLLEDAGDGMNRVLFYSGHGAQLPGYNAAEVVDHVDECLVPYDFNWTKDSAITDDDFYHLYCDLPFSAHFFAVFDCCHSGGLTRDGAHKVRGLTPPDDIRHRMLRWNSEEHMWEERKWSNDDLINPTYGNKEERKAMTGTNGVTYRLGRAMRLWEDISKPEAARLVEKKQGLYVPVLLEACGEGQLSYEYRHGTISYGAFTFAMVKNLRENPRASFQTIMARTAKSLSKLGYDQTPQIVGPSKVTNKAVPGGKPAPLRKKK